MSAPQTKRAGNGRPALGVEKKTRVVKVAFDDVAYMELCRRAPALAKYHYGLLDLQRLCQRMIELKMDPTGIGGELFLIWLRREFGYMHEALAETRAPLLGTNRGWKGAH